MKVLIIGGGGREHALAWKAAQSAEVDAVFVAPGNAGTALEPKVENVAIDVLDFPALVQFANDNNIALTIVGPEAPLVAGVVDYFAEHNLPCFGPGKGAAQLEGSKAFSKEFLSRHNIPTARYQVFTDVGKARAYITEQYAEQHSEQHSQQHTQQHTQQDTERHSQPVQQPPVIVIKADGLAAGKGVIVPQSEPEAIATVEDMLAGNTFGDAGRRVVIEQFMPGEEASFIAMVDGEHILPMATSQDHKARDDGDKGPNTGGMGAYSPAPVVNEQVNRRIMERIIRPTVAGMAAEGNPYTGFLYAGLMIDHEGNPSVVEFNCRFGDPEAQPVMLRLQSDLPRLCLAALEKKLNRETAQWDARYAVGIVLAAGGYPGSYNKGDAITGLPDSQSKNSSSTSPKEPTPHSKIFHAGTTLQDNIVVTNGGRVLCATALGETVSAAQQAAYALVKKISWNNIYYRKDIAHRAITRENQSP
ncbi:MAG: phosphoribosylamine--glycine ligase [Pseudohongiellaceae bacterium]